ncbi:MAG: N-methyl-L-tryptophan oxidase [Sphingobacteriales bacterium]|nr:N-methyl-L-tryptophan oxidase [Sphingobacteriales bacterium]
MKNFDVIVIGVGSMGAATCYRLAERGCSVLGLEQFSIPHTEGSHAGQSRIIRKAYFEHPDYVPLLNRAYCNWQQLEVLTNEKVYFKTGLLYHGPSHHPVIKGVLESASIHGLELKELTCEQSAGRYHQFKIPTGFKTIFEPDAGFVRPEKTIVLYHDEAIKNGAEIHTNERVFEWRKDSKSITVITDRNTYQCNKLIITAGAWAAKLIPQIHTRLKITRQVVLWVRPEKGEIFETSLFPCWLVADDKRPGALYGFPYLPKDMFGEPEGLKFAWHHPADETDPDKVNREVSEMEIQQLINEVAEYIPAVKHSEIIATKTCLYANSPDENFIIDHLPGYDGDVTIACGFSGHGFKFVSVVGEILADLATEGRTELPIDFLRLKRFP